MRFALRGVPTNIITGFLGVGKTTAILSLLSRKPEHERWAVLVNEFGDIGVDGAQLSDVDGLFIKELPGGCMCCATGVPMQITLNTLLREAKPDRLLIEPTGLGHPKQLLKVLQSTHFRNVLNVRATLTLVDARNIADPRYRDNATFNQQLEVADIIIANKADLYQGEELTALMDYLATQNGFNGQPVETLTQTEIPLVWLDTPSGFTHKNRNLRLANSLIMVEQSEDKPLAATDFSQSRNSSNGFAAYGWTFGSAFRFDHERLLSLFRSLKVERLKALCLTDNGMMNYQKTGDSLHIDSAKNANDSRITVITTEDAQLNIDEQIQACLI